MSLEAYILAIYFGLGLIPALGILAFPTTREMLFRGAAWYGIGKREAVVVLIVLCVLFGAPMILYVQLHRPSKEQLAEAEALRDGGARR